jgi:hypothetical protein
MFSHLSPFVRCQRLCAAAQSVAFSDQDRTSFAKWPWTIFFVRVNNCIFPRTVNELPRERWGFDVGNLLPKRRPGDESGRLLGDSVNWVM